MSSPDGPEREHHGRTDEAGAADAAAAPALPRSARALLDALIEAVWLVDAHSLRILAVNAAALRMFGAGADALVGRGVTALAATPEDLAFWSGVVGGAGVETHSLLSHTLLRRFDGSLVPVSRRISRLPDAALPVYVVAWQDRSEEQRSEDARETLLSELQATLESTADGILVTDLSGRIRAFNRRFAALWNLPQDLLLRRDDEAVQAWMRRSMRDGAAYAARLDALLEAPLLQTSDVLHLHSGRVLERVTLPQFSRGQPIGRVFSFRDLSEKIAAEEKIETLSRTDALTGLPNRRVLADRIDWALSMSRRDATPFALLYVDLDRFKHINESLGEQVGDRVLLEVTDRIKGCLRQVDTVARLGGDEFALLIHGADASGAEASARRVLEAMTRPFDVDGMSFTVTCSVGIALHPSDGASVDVLVRNAARAMRGVKITGRASYRFHEPGPDTDPRSRMQLDHAMRQALASGRFRLHYQPQIELASGRLVGAEALIRWRDPELGEVPPGDFIPVAEDSGFIVAIGDWVLREAVRQAAAWHACGWDLPVSVNVSALQFQQADFVDRVACTVRDAGLPAHLLELELTESILLRDAAAALERLEALAALGVAMAIDDFGTGYSSLAYLKRFPIQRLKIDRSFVRGLPDDESDASIVAAIINLGRALDLRVIAEGVETEPQRQCLLDAGCDQFQGFLYAPALEAEQFEARLAPTLRTASAGTTEARGHVSLVHRR